MTPSSAASTCTNESLTEEDPGFEHHIRTLAPALLGYFLRRVEVEEDAADCLSETFMVLWRQRERLPESTDGLRAWSFGIAKGVLSNYRRGKVRQGALSEKLRAGLVHVPVVIDPHDLPIRTALNNLRAKDRELVMLIVWDGFGVADAGSHLGLSATAARSRYARARARLRILVGSTQAGPQPA
jgi:DNA-directed RNA polymerase specialized sigma24 family protein